MKLIVTVGAALILVAGALADITADMDTADILNKDRKWTDALSAYEAVIADYPSGDVSVLATARFRAAHMLIAKESFAEAKAAFEQLIADYPGAGVDRIASSRLHVGHCLALQSRFTEAIAEYEKVLTDYPTSDAAKAVPERMAGAQVLLGAKLYRERSFADAEVEFTKVITDYDGIDFNAQRRAGFSIHKARAQMQLGFCLYRQGKTAEAEAAWLDVPLYGDTPTLRNGVGTFRKYMGRENYRSYLIKVMMAVRAIEDNAEFLGEIAAARDRLE